MHAVPKLTGSQAAQFSSQNEPIPPLSNAINAAMREEILLSIKNLGIENVNLLCLGRLNQEIDHPYQLAGHHENLQWLFNLNLDEIEVVYDYTGKLMDYNEEHFY